ncbi:unnamed protein product [Mytilus edulis]|uniref:Uncharacterized protein n=1 Tax=Mytilus edulis TaxID=6550 RepID=A0A8S3VEP4_MYTED|nr:unnamed protein product [Mytilus edulis]
MEDFISSEKNQEILVTCESRKQDASRIVTLKSKDDFLYSDTVTKASILNQQLQSVYTKEDISMLPDLGNSHSIVNNIIIHERGVYKLLQELQLFKARGLDAVPANIFKQAAESQDLYLTRNDSTRQTTSTDTSPGCFTGLLDQLKWDTLQQTYKQATCPLLQDPEQTSGDTTSYLPRKEQGIAIELDR